MSMFGVLVWVPSLGIRRAFNRLNAQHPLLFQSLCSAQSLCPSGSRR